MAICCAGALLFFLHQNIRTPVTHPAAFLIVKPGTGLTAFSNQLVKEGLARSSWPVTAWALLSGTAGSLKSGEYRVRANASPARILGQVGRGEVHQRKVTIIEGWNLWDLQTRLNQENVLLSTIADVTDSKASIRLSLSHRSPEGLFFPDTYFYVRGETDIDLLGKAARKMSHELDAIWEERGPSLAIQDSYQALILASIIQKEAMRVNEMPRISGVFHNRLNRGMRLQADPTVIYGLGPEFEGRLKRRHLRADTPYNTYTRSGLPIGPIAMPGRAALMAAVNPLKSKELYFMARGDGTHQFSETLKDHNIAVQRYRN